MVYQLPLIVFLLCFVVTEHFPPWTAYHVEVPAFAAVVLALGSSCRSAQQRLPIPSLSLPAIFLLLTVGLQWWSGLLQYAGDAWVVVAYLLVFVAAAWWGQRWAEEVMAGHVIVTMALCLVVAGMLVEFQMLAQWLRVEDRFFGWVIDRPPHGRPYGNLGQPNQAATLLVMASVGILLLHQLHTVRRWTAWLALIFLAWGVVLTQSRTALVSVVLLTVGVTLLAPPRWRKAKQAVIIWLAMVVSMTGMFHSLSWSEEWAGAAQSNLMTAGSRPLMWQQLLAALAERPWLGWGWLQVPAAQQAAALAVPGFEQATFSHNAVLDLALMVGLPACLLIVGWMVWWVWKNFPRMVRHEEMLSGLFLVTPFIVHSMLEYPHAYAYFLVPVGILAGAVGQWLRVTGESVATVPRFMLGISAGTLAALFVGLAIDYSKVEEDFRVNRLENRRMGKTPADYHPPTPLLLTHYGDLLKAMRVRAMPNMSEEDLKLLHRVSRRFSWAPLHFRAALASGLNSQPDLAQKQLWLIKVMYPPAVYEDARDNWLRLQREQYPQLALVILP